MIAETTIPKQWRFAIAGPSGAGKSTVARALMAINPDFACIQEPEPTQQILRANNLDSRIAQEFQEEITTSRSRKAIANTNSPVLIFDRSFEEDREVFLPLYERLKYLTHHQVKHLRRFSFEAEAKVGSPHLMILLTARIEILRRRVIADGQQRPQWLLDHLDVQYELYRAWTKHAASRLLIQDTSEIDSKESAQIVHCHIDKMIQNTKLPK